jgi:two-component system, LytTR family, response regulator
MRIRTLLVDDEEHSIARLRQLCAAHADIRIVGEAQSGAEAIEKLRRLAPSLVFLDVHLGALSGLDVLAALEADELPSVIFMTAYETYAAAAFERDAVDYLLKPCTPERFARALAKLRVRTERGGTTTRADLVAAWSQLLGSTPPPTAGRLDGLFVEDAGRWVFVDFNSIDYIEAARNYVVIHVGKRSFLHRAAISSLEQWLDSTRYARIHKSVIVNLSRVESIESDFNGAYVIRLAGGASCRSGQSYRCRIQELLRPSISKPRAAT